VRHARWGDNLDASAIIEALASSKSDTLLVAIVAMAVSAMSASF
jgi:hypothetical protein